MKVITNLYDLKKYGFDILTDEACKLGCRLLVDLDYQGLQIYCLAYGLREPLEREINEGKSNFDVGYNNGIASVMLGTGRLECYALLGMFAFWSLGVKDVHKIVLVELGGRLVVYGFEEGEDICNEGQFVNNGKVIEGGVDKEYEIDSDIAEHAATWVDSWWIKVRERKDWKIWPESMGMIKDVYDKKKMKKL